MWCYGLSIQNWPRCTVRTFSSSHATNLGATLISWMYLGTLYFKTPKTLKNLYVFQLQWTKFFNTRVQVFISVEVDVVCISWHRTSQLDSTGTTTSRPNIRDPLTLFWSHILLVTLAVFHPGHHRYFATW